MKTWSLIAVSIVLFIIPTLALVSTNHEPSIYFSYETLDGQFFYVLSKWFGFYALCCLWLQVMLGSLRSIGMFNIKNTSHRNLGLLSLSFIVLHAALFVLAVSIRAGHPALIWFIPRFGNGYYVQLVSLGVIAFWSVFVVILSRVFIKTGSLQRWLHRLALPTLILVMLHSYLVGTETRMGSMPQFYLLVAVSLIAVILFQLISWVKCHRSASQFHARQTN